MYNQKSQYALLKIFFKGNFREKGRTFLAEGMSWGEVLNPGVWTEAGMSGVKEAGREASEEAMGLQPDHIRPCSDIEDFAFDVKKKKAIENAQWDLCFKKIISPLHALGSETPGLCQSECWTFLPWPCRSVFTKQPMEWCCDSDPPQINEPYNVCVCVGGVMLAPYVVK